MHCAGVLPPEVVGLTPSAFSIAIMNSTTISQPADAVTLAQVLQQQLKKVWSLGFWVYGWSLQFDGLRECICDGEDVHSMQSVRTRVEDREKSDSRIAIFTRPTRAF